MAATVAVALGSLPSKVRAHCWVGLGVAVKVAVIGAGGRAKNQYLSLYLDRITMNSEKEEGRREKEEGPT
jgi:hypothetical protein